jgi:glycosyltransferase involved in cell wall biosynthesis
MTGTYTTLTKKLVIILPAHNEAKFLAKAVDETAYYAEKICKNWVIVIAEDGSKDGTLELAYKLEKTRKNVKVVHSDVKLGRGKAVKRVMKLFDADIYAYLDVDLATDMTFFYELINSIEKGYDIVTGSRYTKGAVISRPALRLLVSKTYNWLCRLLFQSRIFDHQCGFKAFSRRVRDELLDECVNDDWFWDTEILILGAKKKYRIREFPVYWMEKRFIKTPLRRLFNDIRIHAIGLLKLYWRVNFKSKNYFQGNELVRARKNFTI